MDYLPAINSTAWNSPLISLWSSSVSKSVKLANVWRSQHAAYVNNYIRQGVVPLAAAASAWIRQSISDCNNIGRGVRAHLREIVSIERVNQSNMHVVVALWAPVICHRHHHFFIYFVWRTTVATPFIYSDGLYSVICIFLFRCKYRHVTYAWAVLLSLQNPPTLSLQPSIFNL